LKTTTSPSAPPARNPLIPLLILVLAVLVLELQEVLPMESAYRDIQSKAQLQAFADLNQRAQNAIQSNARVEGLLGRLLESAKTDLDARAIVIRHQIMAPQPQATNP
jgi:hypothetical protein